MNGRKERRKAMKQSKMITGLVAGMMLVLSVSFLPGTIHAESTPVEKDGIIYDKSYDMSDYWSEDEKKAPIMDGYVFGGWYTSEDETDFTALKMSQLNADGIPKSNVYAKFVPANVLTMMTQVANGTTESTEATHLRVITTIDALDYGKVGFDIWYNNKESLHSDVHTKKAFTSLTYTEDGEEQTANPDELFDETSEYFVILKINNIKNANFNKIINVRPYWMTLDGTKVEGMAKYMHIEDGYNNYLSVPINLQSGKEVAAGVVTMKYDKDTLELVQNGNAIELGKIFKEMEYSVDEEKGIITFAANSDAVDSKDIANGIYVNVRFKVKSGKTDLKHYNFDIDAAKNSFANWDENYVDVYAVDYKY